MDEEKTSGQDGKEDTQTLEGFVPQADLDRLRSSKDTEIGNLKRQHLEEVCLGYKTLKGLGIFFAGLSACSTSGAPTRTCRVPRRITMPRSIRP